MAQTQYDPKIIKLPYSNLSNGLTDREAEVQFAVEGLIVSLFIPLSRLDKATGTVMLTEVDRQGDFVLIELPGEPMNTSRRLQVDRQWLEGALVR